MNRNKVQEKTRQLKSYISAIEMESSRPIPNYMFIQSKVNILPKLVEELQKELK